MAIKKYYATKDNTITNAYGIDLSTRATGSNMGAADILEVFSIYGSQTTSSSELSRVLIEFPVTDVSSDRTAGTIPASGSVNFYLRMFNARHSEQLPENFTFDVMAVSSSWEEGTGLDMETYEDKTKDAIAGSNWKNRTQNTAWELVGGDYHSSSYVSGSTMPNYTTSFVKGTEDILLDVTEVVEEWIAGNQSNNGFGIFLTSSQEAHTTASDGDSRANTSGAQKSYYTKRFFSRSSEFFFKRPVLEARWDSRENDDRGNFYYSSSLAPANDNLNTIYLYNYVRGQLKNIPGLHVDDNKHIYVSIYSGSADNSAPSGDPLVLTRDTVHVSDTNKLIITGGFVSTGIYSASFALTASTEPLQKLFDVWFTGSSDHSSTTQFFTGSITPSTLVSPGWNQYQQYVSKITNLKPKYSKEEQAKFRVFVRPRNFSPTIYTVASTAIDNTIIESGSYEVIRMIDEETVINHSTGSSTNHTYLSYDVSGSYFDLDMSMLEPGYMYGIKLAYHTSNGWREQEEVFKFRVEDN